MAEFACDVAVVGAGPAGLAAAVTAAEAGAAVRVFDQAPAQGGQIWRRDRNQVAARARAWLARAVDAGVRFSPSTEVIDARVGHALLVSDAHQSEWVRPKKMVLALGARERFLPFPGWTLPSVSGVGGLQALVKGGFDVHGKRILIAGSGPLLLAVAADLSARGARLVGIVEQASRSAVLGAGVSLLRNSKKRTQALAITARLRSCKRHYQAWVEEVTEGPRGLEVHIRGHRGQRRRVECDLLACGYGLVPETALAELLGCQIQSGSIVVDERQRCTTPNVLAAGECTGVGGVDLALLEGEVAGHVAADSQPPPALSSARRAEFALSAKIQGAFMLNPRLADLPRPETIVCRCEEVRFAQLRLFTDARAAKLRTRCGMGPCQGRICGPALEFCLGFERGRPRPPLFPVPFDNLTGRSDAS